jgi:hypothetical protein
MQARDVIEQGWQQAMEHLDEFDELWLLHVSGYGDPRTWNTRWQRIRRQVQSASEEPLHVRVYGETREARREAQGTTQPSLSA